MTDRTLNRKLLVSVFNAQEAREAVLGGARIVDSEDPRSALGNIKPRHIMAISDAVLDFKRDEEVQLSTNIGEDQLLFDRGEDGVAIEKSQYEIAGKASQAAIGVAVSMGNHVHSCNLVKVGVDGMPVHLVGEVLEEVVHSLNRTESYSHSQVMSVLFAQDIAKWKSRQEMQRVRNTLVQLREFSVAKKDGEEGAIDLCDYSVRTLLDSTGRYTFSDKSEVSHESLIKKGVLPAGSNSTFVHLNDLHEHGNFFPGLIGESSRTTREVIKAMVDITADAGADAIMLDTRIQTKVARISLIDTDCEGLVDLNKFDIRDMGDGAVVSRTGILTLEELKFFVDYCHYRGIVANLAGSVQSYQAQQIWAALPQVDQISTRGGSSAVTVDPYNPNSVGENTRQFRVIKRTLVNGLAPPEHGGALNIPDYMYNQEGCKEAVEEVKDSVNEYRNKNGYDDLSVFVVDKHGTTKEV